MNPVLAGILAGVIVGECGPWTALLAVKLVQCSARLRYLDRARGEIRAEELAAYVRDRPGNLCKLCTALWFMAGASAYRGRHWLRVRREVRTAGGALAWRVRVSARSATRAAVAVGGGGVLLMLVVDLIQAPAPLVSLVKVVNGALIGTGALVALVHAGAGRRVGTWLRQYRARPGRRR